MNRIQKLASGSGWNEGIITGGTSPDLEGATYKEGVLVAVGEKKVYYST